MKAACTMVVALLAVVSVAAFGDAQAPRRGGVLNAMLGEDPPGFSIHESATISGLWPVAPCYSNLVIFDPLKPNESVQTVLPELAEKWSWQDNQPFTSRDVKYTFDIVRETPEATAKLRINPRKDWYSNVEAIEAADPHTVIFRLKRPQPALLLMLAAGYSPVYPAHIPLADLRQRCVGTGPFKLRSTRAARSSCWSGTPTTSCRADRTSMASAIRSSPSAARGWRRCRPDGSMSPCRSR
jgi:peptide/nickel transport system substrate-binding protein